MLQPIKGAVGHHMGVVVLIFLRCYLKVNNQSRDQADPKTEANEIPMISFFQTFHMTGGFLSNRECQVPVSIH